MNTFVTRALLAVAALCAVASPVNANSTIGASPSQTRAPSEPLQTPNHAPRALPNRTANEEKKTYCEMNCTDCSLECITSGGDEKEVEKCIKTCMKENSRCCYAIGEVPKRNDCGCM